MKQVTIQYYQIEDEDFTGIELTYDGKTWTNMYHLSEKLAWPNQVVCREGVSGKVVLGLIQINRLVEKV